MVHPYTFHWDDVASQILWERQGIRSARGLPIPLGWSIAHPPMDNFSMGWWYCPPACWASPSQVGMEAVLPSLPMYWVHPQGRGLRKVAFLRTDGHCFSFGLLPDGFTIAFFSILDFQGWVVGICNVHQESQSIGEGRYPGFPKSGQIKAWSTASRSAGSCWFRVPAVDLAWDPLCFQSSDVCVAFLVLVRDLFLGQSFFGRHPGPFGRHPSSCGCFYKFNFSRFS